MSYVVTNVGRDWLEGQMAPGDSQDKLSKVVVGDGTTDESTSDTSLDNPLYTASDSGGASIDTTPSDGEISVVIDVTGGSDVDAGTDIYELGTKTSNGILFHREVRNNPITIESGETKTIEFTIKLNTS